MSRRALVFRHMADDSHGHVGELLAADGYSLDIVNLHAGEAIPPLAGYDAMLVLGGAQQVWEEDLYPWLAGEKQAIREWVADRARPYIGICLGHQLLATALGGEAGLASQREMGVHQVDFNPHEAGHAALAGLPERATVTQWHLAEVTRAPERARVLASSAVTANQMMAVGDHAVSVQFHFEWTGDTIAAWPESWVRQFEATLGEGAHARFIAEARAVTPAMNAIAGRVWANLEKAAGIAPRRLAPVSLAGS